MLFYLPAMLVIVCHPPPSMTGQRVHPIDAQAGLFRDANLYWDFDNSNGRLKFSEDSVVYVNLRSGCEKVLGRGVELRTTRGI